MLKTSAIFIPLHLGETGKTDELHLKSTSRTAFHRSGTDTFVTTTPHDLGELCMIRIWHDNTGGDWYLR